MKTRSELIQENKELTDRKELLELRQENRKLKRQIQELEGGKSMKIKIMTLLPDFAILAVTIVCVAIIIAATAGWI